MEKRKTNNITNTVIRNHKRITKIHELMSSGVNQISDMKGEVGGSAYLYTVLTSKNVLIKGTTRKEGYTWNEKIPVTELLAKTVSDEIRKKHINKLEVRQLKNSKVGRKEFSVLWGLIKFNY